MNEKACLHYEVEENGRKYELILPPEAQLGEAYDALMAMLQEILKKAQDRHESIQKQVEKKEKGEAKDGEQ